MGFVFKSAPLLRYYIAYRLRFIKAWSSLSPYSGFQKATTVVTILARPHHVLSIRSAALSRRRLRCNSLKSAIHQAFLDLSITKKLVAINLIFALGALIITFASILLVLSSRMENFALNEIQAQARVISFNIAGALSDGDVPTVNRVLGTLSEMPTIVEATVFDSQHKPLAQYLRSTNSNKTVIELPGLLGSRQGEVGSDYFVRDAHLYVLEPISVAGSVVGILFP